MKMRKSLSILIIAVALLVQSGTQAQNTYTQSGIKARGRGTRLILKSLGKTHVVDVNGKIDAAKLDDVEILFATRRPPFIYLLVAACGSSKLKSDDRQCGAGQECNLLWIKLNDNWRIADIKSVHYESCWTYITSTDGYKIKDNTLEMEYNDFNQKKNYKLTYDASRPENGFTLEESPITDNEP
jgi:hypothetical protein